MAVASKHVRDQPVLPRVANPAVPPALNAIIMKAMAKSPDERYGSAEELRADLLRFADGRPVEAVDPGMTSMMTALGTTTMMAPTTGRTMAVLDGTALHPAQDDEARKKRTAAWSSSWSSPGGPRHHRLLPAQLLLVSKVTCPDVAGSTQSVAAQTLKSDGLALGTPSFQTNSQPKDTVLSQNPSSGTSVDKNSTVDLVVSNGPNIPIVTVPSVTGQQLTAAITADSARA